jgi:SAM-dependent methyltransferase
VRVASPPLALYFPEACVVCGTKGPGRRIGEVREHEYEGTTDELFPVHECPRCRLVYLYPRPASSEIPRIYPSHYYSYDERTKLRDGAAAEAGTVSFTRRLFRRLNTARLVARLGPLVRRGQSASPLRVVDIGCGAGNHLDIVRGSLSCETHGVEVDAAAGELARRAGHIVHLGYFEELDLPPALFDLAISYHVIEHSADPRRFLERAHHVLKDGGHLLLETPNTDCVDFALFKRRHWGGYHAPRHWYLFRQENLTELARQVGFSCVRAEPCRTSNFWVWTSHSLLTDLAGRRVADAVFPPVRVLYGGLQSFVLLGLFTVLEGGLRLVTGKANSMWLLLRKEPGA